MPDAEAPREAAPSRMTVRLASLTRRRLSSLERPRFTSSGSDAVVSFTRRGPSRVGERSRSSRGGFHRSEDPAQVGVAPPWQKPRPGALAPGRPEETGQRGREPLSLTTHGR
jgi:glutamate-1-semialdehyde aminotransferase